MTDGFGFGDDPRSAILAWQADPDAMRQMLEADRQAVVDGIRALAGAATVELLGGDDRRGALLALAVSRDPDRHGDPRGLVAERISVAVGSLRLGVLVVVGARVPARRWRPLANPHLRLARLVLHVEALATSGLGHVDDLRRARRLTTAADDRVRMQVAEQLHGRVQTRLVVVWHRLGELLRLVEAEPARARTEIAALRDLVDEIRERDVREVSRRLHPVSTRVALEPALRSAVAAFAGMLDVELIIDPELRWLDDPSAPAVPETVRVALYRIVEEALGNVGQHARAQHVRVCCSLAGASQLELVITDDGVGLAARPVRRGLGLTTVADRVDGLQGRWSLRSAPGSGTTLWVQIPIPPAAAPGGPAILPWLNPADHQVGGEVALAQDGGEAEGEGRVLVGGGVSGGDQQNGGGGRHLLDTAGGDQPGDVGHEEVQEHDVRVQAPR